MRGKAVIAGVGHTAFGKLNRSTVSLTVEACREALEDAGIEKSGVDAVLMKTPTLAQGLMFGQTRCRSWASARPDFVGRASAPRAHVH